MSRCLSELLAQYPRLVVAGLSSETLRLWLETNARPDHLILSNRLTGAAVVPFRETAQVRSNNAQILLLSSEGLRALTRYKNFRHAAYLLVPRSARLSPLWALCLGHHMMRGKLVPSGQYEAAGTTWQAFRVQRRKPLGERVYIPRQWKLSGFTQRLNEQGAQYVLLRWWERLQDWPEDDDADILASDADSVRIRALLEEQLGSLPVDLYSVSGGATSGGDSMAYYPPPLAEQILANAVLSEHGCRVPAPRDDFFSLAYHALYHKGLASGLPTSTPGCEAALHKRKFREALQQKAANLQIAPERLATMETLDELLLENGWQPPMDMLARYSHRNTWVKARFFGPDKARRPAGLCVFVVRELAEQWGVVDAIGAALTAEGFTILAKTCIPQPERPEVAKQLRGGNWSSGPWAADGGLPAVAFVVADISPLRVKKSHRRDTPLLDNERVLVKRKLRDQLNAGRPPEQQANVIHTSDNTAEALYYIETLLGPRRREGLYQRFLQLRGFS